jgi:hypothetical protein
MNIDYKAIKHYLKNVYFINGTAYAGKSTVCKILAEKHNMYHFGENHKYGDFLELTSPSTHPHMNYFKTMSSWEEFVLRDKEDYDQWLEGVDREVTPFQILELVALSRNQKVMAEVNIPHEILVQIADYNQILYMVATPELATEHFFNRPDREKQFLLDVLKNTEHPDISLKHYRDTIAYCNRQEKIDAFLNSGCYVIQRLHEQEDIHEKVRLAEIHFLIE